MFSLDSVITAVGMVSHVPVMIAAIVVAVLVMMLCAGAISNFIDKHPSLKMLALSFLIVVGTVLIAESFDVHVPKGYVYFAMAFSLAVEAINIRMRTALARKGGKDHDPVKLRRTSQVNKTGSAEPKGPQPGLFLCASFHDRNISNVCRPCQAGARSAKQLKLE